MSIHSKNWGQRRQLVPAANYVNLLPSVNVSRKAFIVINDTANSILLYMNGSFTAGPGSDTDSFTLAAGQSFDFGEQAPINGVWAKALVGDVSPLIMEA